MPKRRLQPPHRFVYVIGPVAGLQKVGLATDPRTRLAALQTACPFDLVLHVAVAVPFGDAHAIERRAHRALARCCVRNEWFDTTPAEAVAAVQAAAEAVATPVQPMPVEWRARRAPHGTLDGLPLFGFQSATRTRPVRRPLWHACQVMRGSSHGRSWKG